MMNRHTRSLIPILMLALGAAAPSAPAQVPRDSLAKQVDQIFSRWARSDSPGAAVVVVRDGEVVYQNGYGSANLDYGIPITPSTAFDIASVSKHFTAFAVVMLAEQGKLSLDDDVRKHVPEVPDFGRKVTLRQLIHHTSGIRDWVELLSLSGYRFDDVIARHDILTFVRHQKGLNFEPGTEHLYSNTGYNLLAETVARVSGVPFAEFMQRNVFHPLGMTSTHIQTDHQRVIRNRATSYAPNEHVDELSNLHARRPPADGSWRIWVDNTGAPGSSSVVTTVEDMARWIRNFETAQVGGPGVMRQMLQRGRLNDGREIPYGFGLSVENHRGLQAVSHGGGWRGFRTHFVRFPEQRLAVAVFGNSTSFDAGGTAMRVAEVYLGDRLGPAQTGYDRVDADPRAQRSGGGSIPADRLAEFVGEYHSDELGATYRVVAEQGALVVKHRKMPDQTLTHAGGDRFVTPGVRGELTYEFVRGPDNRVTGYRLAGARFRGVPFTRQERSDGQRRAAPGF